jgi:peptidyl-prolyl cis-trans isomerase D
MLQFIRDKSQGIIAFVIMGLIALTFALWGIHNYFNGSAKQAPVATVNGHKIEQQEFSLAFNRIRQNLMQREPQLFESQTSVNAVKRQLLSSMVDNSLLTQFAADNGFGVGQDLLELSLAQMPAFQVNGEFSKFRFEQFLSSMMYTQSSFFNSLRTNILLAQIKSGFTETAFALPYQVSNSINLINEGRQFAYAEIPATKFSKEIKVSKAAVKAYYNANPGEFTIPTKVSASYIELNMKTLEANIHPTDEQLQNYYNENINHYTVPKKWHAAHILIAVTAQQGKQALAAAYKKADMIEAKLKKGASFSDLAKKYSEDLTTASKGGEMPWVTFFQISKTWQNELYALKKVGDVSPVFKTSAGLEIVKLLGTKPAVVEPYSKVAKKVKKNYLLQQAEKQFANYTDDLANLTFEHPDSLKPAAQQLKLKIQKTDLFTKKGPNTGIAKNQRFVAAAFSGSVLNGGNNSDTVNLSDTSVVVLRVDKKIPSHLEKLEKVTPTILSKLKAKQESAKAKAMALAMSKEVESGKSLASLAKTNSVTFKSTSKAVTRNNYGKLNSAVVYKAFHLQIPTKQLPSVGITKLDHGGYAVVQLTKVDGNQLSKKKMAEMHKYYVAGTQKSLGDVEYYLFLHHLKQTADIKYHDKSFAKKS